MRSIEFMGVRLAADLQLLADLRAKERIWALKAPNWSNPTKGQHFLATPRGVLSAQRFLLGWVIKRNDKLLNWLRHKGPVVFGNLASAKVAALVHMHGLEKECFMDGTYWALSDCTT
jgi:hypothetical protein